LCTAAAIVTSLYALTIWTPGRTSGLVRTIVANADRREIVDVRRVAAIDLEGIGPAPDGRSGLSASWDGEWEVEEGFYDLRLESRGRSSWTIDRVLAVEAGTGSGGLTRLVRLSGGL